MSDVECLIWGTNAKISGGDYGFGAMIDSPRAGGRYTAQGLSVDQLRQLPIPTKCKLSFEIAKANQRGIEFELSGEFLKKIESQPSPSPSERADMLLRLLAHDFPNLGMRITYHQKHDGDIPRWFAWSCSDHREEITALLDFLERLGHVGVSRSQNGAVRMLKILPEGFLHVEASKVNPLSDQAFVAMWFDKSMDEAYEGGIGKAIEGAGYIPMIIRQKEFNNYIDDEIISEIRKSKFVVADFTSMSGQPRGGVYFEAGFAKGLGLEVIWTCRADQIKKVHFDTRQFNHIVWKDVEDLHRQLKVRIGATIGWGPHK